MQHVASEVPCAEQSPVVAASYPELCEAAVRHLPHLRRVARRLSADHAEADDLVQETYCHALRQLGQVRNIEHCRAWLTAILRRRAIARYRRREARPPIVYLGGSDDPEGQAADAIAAGEPSAWIELREIRRKVDDLPQAQRHAWALRELGGFSYEEIAERTRAPVGTVRSRIARARAALLRTVRFRRPRG